MRLKKGFITHMLGDEQLMVAAGPAAKVFHGLVRSNETAAFIVDCLKTECSADDILAKIQAVYEVNDATARRDIQVILEKLRSIGAIEE